MPLGSVSFFLLVGGFEQYSVSLLMQMSAVCLICSIIVMLSEMRYIFLELIII